MSIIYARDEDAGPPPSVRLSRLRTYRLDVIVQARRPIESARHELKASLGRCEAALSKAEASLARFESARSERDERIARLAREITEDRSVLFRLALGKGA